VWMSSRWSGWPRVSRSLHNARWIICGFAENPGKGHLHGGFLLRAVHAGGGGISRSCAMRYGESSCFSPSLGLLAILGKLGNCASRYIHDVIGRIQVPSSNRGRGS